MTSRIPKEPNELVGDLKENLQILSEALKMASDGKRFSRRIISNQLRLLICDKSSNKTDGLLTWFVKECNFHGKIQTNQSEMTLDEFKDMVVFKEQEGSHKAPLKFTMTICDVIRSMSQQDGGSHVDLEREPNYWRMRAVLDMGRSKKTDPELGVILSYGVKVLEFGERFLRESFGIELSNQS